MKYEPIIVRRTTAGIDTYDDPIPGIFTDHLTLIGKFAPSNSSEPVEVGRKAIITGGVVYVRDLKSRPDVSSADRVKIRDVEYEIEGDIGEWLRLETWAIQFAVKLVKG